MGADRHRWPLVRAAVLRRETMAATAAKEMQMSCRWKTLLPAVVMGLTASSAAWAAPSALELSRRSDQQHRLSSERTEVTMWLQGKGEKPDQRQLSILTVQDDKNGDRTLIRFHAPAAIKDTALLSIEDPRSGDEEQWLYLPAFARTRRVGASELGDRFVGTDLFYEDMKRRRVDDFSYTMLRSEKWTEATAG